MPEQSRPVSELEAENAALQRRVSELEREVQDLRADTAAIVASAQETLYWFERWGVDFNSLMARPQAETARKAVRGVRAVYRWFLAKKRRFLS